MYVRGSKRVYIYRCEVCVSCLTVFPGITMVEELYIPVESRTVLSRRLSFLYISVNADAPARLDCSLDV